MSETTTAFERDNHLDLANKKITKIVRFGDYVVFFRENTGYLSVYDKHGKLIKDKELVLFTENGNPQETIWSDTLTKFIQSNCKKTGTIGWYRLDEIHNRICEIFQLDISVSSLEKRIKLLTGDSPDSSKEYNIKNFKSLNLKNLLYDWINNITTKITENGSIICFKGCDDKLEIKIIITKDQQGNNLPLDDWKILHYKGEKNWKQAISSLPSDVVRALENIQDTVEVDKGHYSITKNNNRITIKGKNDSTSDEITFNCFNSFYKFHPTKPHIVCFLGPQNTITVLNTKNGISPKRWVSGGIKLPDNISSFKFDPNGNHIIYTVKEAVTTQKSITTLKIFSIDEKKIIKEFPDMAGDFHIDFEGTIFMATAGNKPVIIRTNFKSIVSKYEREEAKKQSLLLNEVGSALDINEAEVQSDKEIEIAVSSEIETKQREVLAHYVEEIHEAQTVNELEALQKKIAKAKDRLCKKGLAKDTVDQIFNPTLEAIINREFLVVETVISTFIEETRDRIQNISLLPINEMDGLLVNVRGAINTSSRYNVASSSQELTHMRDTLELEIRRQWQENKDERMSELKDDLSEILGEIHDIDNLIELASFKDQNTKYIKLINKLRTYRRQIGSEEVSTIKSTIKTALTLKKSELKTKEREEKDRIEKERQIHLREIDTEIQGFDEELQDKVSTIFDLERIERSSENLAAIRKNIETLESEDDQNAKLNLLNKVIEKHRSRIQHGETLRTTGDKRFAIFGAEKFPIFDDSQENKETISWEIGWDIQEHSSNPNKDKFIFFFECSDGSKKYLSEMISEVKHLLNGAKIPTWLYRRDFEDNMDNSGFYLNQIKRYLEKVSNADLNKSRIPEIPDELIFTQEIMDSLELLAKLAKMQLGTDREGNKKKNSQGMILLEGDTGTGKDILIDIFCAQTKRPLFVFDCSQWTQNREFSYTYEFQGRTIRVDSEVKKALSTPGAMLYFNEFNQLSSAAQKYLNSLLSHRRKIAGAFNNNKETEQDVLITGSMNGRKGYHGTAIEASSVSRLRYLEVDYLQEKRSIWECSNEVVAYCQKLLALKNLSTDDLKLIWNYVVNKEIDDANRTKLSELLTPDRTTSISMVKKALSSQNKLNEREWLYHYSEAYAMAKLTTEFSNMTEEDFKKIWDYIINNKRDNGADDLINNEKRKLIISFKLVVQVANNIRRQFRMTHSGEDVNEDEEVKFIASLRESGECAKEIDYVHELFEGGEDLAVEALRTVIIPKIPLKTERTYLETLFTQGVTTK